MKTRKHRKWYHLNGMLRHGKYEGVVESTYAIYHLEGSGDVSVVATGPYIVLCRGQGIAVSKALARLTAGIPASRLYVMAIALEGVESVRQQLEGRCTDMQYRFGGSVKMTAVELKLTP